MSLTFPDQGKYHMMDKEVNVFGEILETENQLDTISDDVKEIISYRPLSIVYLIRNPTSNWIFVGLCTTFSAAALSWLQVKRYQELKQSYTTASQELNLIVSLSDTISTEDEFSKFVLDSENAVSREHTLWLAQKRR